MDDSFWVSPRRFPPNGAIAEVQHWALEHLDEPLDVDRLATHARMSRRSFIRKMNRTAGGTAESRSARGVDREPLVACPQFGLGGRNHEVAGFVNTFLRG